VGRVALVEVELTTADSTRIYDIQRHSKALVGDIIVSLKNLKTTGDGGAHNLNPASSSAYYLIEVCFAVPNHVGKAGLKERQLKTSPVVAFAEQASCAKMNDSGHDGVVWFNNWVNLRVNQGTANLS